MERAVGAGHRHRLVKRNRDPRRRYQRSLNIAAHPIDVVKDDRCGYVGHRTLRGRHGYVRPFLPLLLIFRHTIDPWGEQISVARLSEPPWLRDLACDKGLSPLIARVREECRREMDLTALDANRYASAIVERHRDPGRVTNRNCLSVRHRFERKTRRNLRRRRNAGIFTREIIPDHAFSSKSPLALGFMLRATVRCYLLIGQTKIRIVLAHVDRDGPILGRESCETVELERDPRRTEYIRRKPHRISGQVVCLPRYNCGHLMMTVSVARRS